jgi:hypothetical protein
MFQGIRVHIARQVLLVAVAVYVVDELIAVEARKRHTHTQHWRASVK